MNGSWRGGALLALAGLALAGCDLVSSDSGGKPGRGSAEVSGGTLRLELSVDKDIGWFTEARLASAQDAGGVNHYGIETTVALQELPEDTGGGNSFGDTYVGGAFYEQADGRTVWAELVLNTDGSVTYRVESCDDQEEFCTAHAEGAPTTVDPLTAHTLSLLWDGLEGFELTLDGGAPTALDLSADAPYAADLGADAELGMGIVGIFGTHEGGSMAATFDDAGTSTDAARFSLYDDFETAGDLDADRWELISERE